MKLIALVGTAAIILHFSPSTHAAVEDAGVHRVAVFPIVVRGRLPRKIAQAIQKSLIEGAKTLPNLEVLTGRDLRKQLGRKPQGAFRICERAPDFGTCLAGYVRKLQVDEVLAARAKATPDGVLLLVVAVDRSGDAEVRLKATVRSVAEIQATLTEEKLPDVFGQRPPEPEPPPPEPEPEPETPAEADAPPQPPPPPEPPDGQATPPAPADDGAAPVADEPSPALAANQGTGHEQEAVAVVVAQNGPASPVDKVVAFEPPPEAEGISWLGVTGIVSMVAGAAGAGAGIYFGLEANRLRQEVNDANGSLLQKEAIQKYDQANQNATFANVFIIAGASLFGVGSGFLVFDLASD